MLIQRAAMVLLLMCGSLFVIVVQAGAQGETTSAITGQVRDPTGAVIAGATVTITNRDTGLARALKTDQEGRFNFPQLPPGNYAVRAEATGFAAWQSDNVFA